MLLLKLDLGRLENYYGNVRVEHDVKRQELRIEGDGGHGAPPVDITFNIEVPPEEQARIVEQATSQALYSLLKP